MLAARVLSLQQYEPDALQFEPDAAARDAANLGNVHSLAGRDCISATSKHAHCDVSKYDNLVVMGRRITNEGSSLTHQQDRAAF